MLDEHKLSVSSCLSNVTNPNQNNQPSVQFIHIITRYNTSSVCLSLCLFFHRKKSNCTRKKSPPITLRSVVWSAPIRHQKFSPSPSSITMFSNNRITLTEAKRIPTVFTERTLILFVNFHLMLNRSFSQNMVILIYIVD